jgi:hypothetical protein
MSIITRPVKTGGGTDVVAGNDVLAEEWNGDLNTIYSDYDGNITNANCSAAMGLVGTKLADAPNGVPTAKINDLAVTTAKLNDLSVTKAKVAAAAVSLDKTLTLVQVKNVPAVSVPSSGTGLVSVSRWTNGANYEATVMCINPAGVITFTNIVPTTAIPTATKELIGLYVANITFSGGVTNCDIVFISIDRT